MRNEYTLRVAPQACFHEGSPNLTPFFDAGTLDLLASKTDSAVTCRFDLHKKK